MPEGAGKWLAVTEHGTEYRIDFDNDRWTRTKNGYTERFGRIHFLLLGVPGTLPRFGEDDLGGNWISASKPEPGYAMYIQGRGMHDWYRSTEIVIVEEIDDVGW